MENIKSWCSKIYNNLQEKNKNLVLIGGASCSGKSTSAEILCKYLQRRGKKPLLISADMYYKGVAKYVTLKALQDDKFVHLKDKAQEISNNVRKIICDSAFEEKFCEENIFKLINTLSPILKGYNVLEFVELLRQKYETMSFDEPFSIDFELLGQDIKNLQNGKSIIVPEYSFDTSEKSYYEKNRRNGKDYDCLVVEGLYCLRPELLDQLDNKNIVTTFIDCDRKTLLARRLYRDILNPNKRTKFTAQTTFMMTVDKVLPSTELYIEPTIKNAQIVLNTGITDKEIESKNVINQEKYSADAENIISSQQNGDVDIVKKLEQTDYYFKDKKLKNKITLRLRVQDGQLVQISFDIGEDIRTRRTETYDLITMLDKKYRDFEFIKNLLIKSGFIPQLKVDKIRYVMFVNAINKKVRVNFDRVKGMGDFAEIVDADLEDKAYIETLLNLSKPKNISYLNMYYKQNNSKLTHTYKKDLEQ